MIKKGYFDFNNILLDEKSCENILIYDVSCKTLIHTKPLRIMFDKVDGFVRDFCLRKSIDFARFCNTYFVSF